MTLRSMPALGWTAAIAAACLVPSSWLGSGGTGGGPSWFERVLGPLLGPLPADKAVHFGMFAVFVLLWRWAGASPRSTALGGVALAVLTELGQSIPALERTTDLDDLVADLLGLAAGLLAWRLLRERQPEPAPAP